MRKSSYKALKRWGLCVAGVFVLGGLACAPAVAWQPVGESGTAAKPDAVLAPSPLEQLGLGGPAFDLLDPNAGRLSLQLAGPPLRLDSPINLRGASQLRPSAFAGSATSVSALEFDLDDQLSLGFGAGLEESRGSFQALGSIHCENGVLDAVSYRATDCYFVERASLARTGTLQLGATLRPNDNMAASVNLFRSEAGMDRTLAGSSLAGGQLLDSLTGGRAPLGSLGSPGGALPGAYDPLSGVQRFDSEITGVNLEFQVGVSTDRAGDMVLGLQLTRVLDSQAETALFTAPGLQRWTLAEPVDSARLSFDWSRGAFSGGIQSYYQEGARYLGAGPGADLATFDVHFSWRAPWNASVSVGASNVLSAGDEDGAGADSSLTDPFESVYGRIPYVRYKQDL
jgi:hypothetical protein